MDAFKIKLIKMEIEEFKDKFIIIINNIQNTNYGSIVAEFKLVILIQELLLTNIITKETLTDIFDEEMIKNSDFEAKRQVLGEISSNIKNSHKCVSILNDYGKDYINNLFELLNLFISSKKLFDECND